MTLSSLWARITGADKRTQFPDQQAVALGRVGDYAIIFPYGLYADLPAETLLRQIDKGVALPVTVKRPSDTVQGEPVFFHPSTNTRIIARNNGDLDIITTEGEGDVNISTVNANITASAEANITAPETTIDGNLTVTGNTTLGANVTSNGTDISDTHTHSGSATAPTGPVAPTGVPV